MKRLCLASSASKPGYKVWQNGIVGVGDRTKEPGTRYSHRRPGVIFSDYCAYFYFHFTKRNLHHLWILLGLNVDGYVHDSPRPSFGEFCTTHQMLAALVMRL